MTHSCPAGSARIPRAATFLSLVLVVSAAAACSDDSARSLGPELPTKAALSYLGATGDGRISFISDVDPSKCVTIVGAIVEGAETALKPCDGSESQLFSVLDDGTIRATESLCLDAFSGYGNDGDKLVVWTCHGGTNQIWRPTEAREVRGIMYKCMDVADGGYRPGQPIILWRCHGGANQKWTARDAGSGSAPTPAPTPPANPPSGDLVATLLGSLPSSNALLAMGGVYARYESDFQQYDDAQWATCGPRWDCINYYDRAKIYYAWWKRTGNPKYLDRGNQVAINFRDNYLERNGYGLAHHWAMMEGVALHYAITGDQESLTAVGKVADVFGWMVRSGEGTVLMDPRYMDNRVQAYYLRSLLVAHLAKAPSVGVAQYGFPGGNNWADLLRRGLDKILATRDSDGQWRGARCQTASGLTRATHPFTVGLLHDALVEYYERFEADPRIPAAIRQSADVMWRQDWVPPGVKYANPYDPSEIRTSPGAFKYVGIDCPGEGTDAPTGDLNQIILNGYAFVGRVLGDATFASRADAIFAGGVNYRGVTAGIKHFNQQYTGSLYYLRNRLR